MKGICKKCKMEKKLGGTSKTCFDCMKKIIARADIRRSRKRRDKRISKMKLFAR